MKVVGRGPGVEILFTPFGVEDEVEVVDWGLLVRRGTRGVVGGFVGSGETLVRDPGSLSALVDGVIDGA